MANKKECVNALKLAKELLEKAYLNAPKYGEAKTFRAEIVNAVSNVQSAINRSDDMF